LARLPSGEIVFLSRVIDGELVSLRTGPTARAAALERIVEPSTHRVVPACPFAQSCGGCDFMHIDSDHQTLLHTQIVETLLRHACGSCPPVTVHAPSAALRYRSRARFSLRFDKGKARFGYRAHAAREVVAVDDCLVLHEDLVRAASLVTSFVAGGRGEADLSVAFGARAGTRLPVIDLSMTSDPPPRFIAQIAEACGETGVLAGARVSLAGALRPLVFGDPRSVQPGADGMPIAIRAGGFAQASDEGALLLATRAADLARPEGLAVFELFSGSGTLSVAIARGARTFTSVEEDSEAVACARQNFEARGLTGKLRVGNAEETELPAQLDMVVLDPPRAGAPGAVRAIVKAKPKRVVYVSCDPPTLARDLKTLVAGGYALEAVETVELFPQTSHVETIVALGRARAKK